MMALPGNRIRQLRCILRKGTSAPLTLPACKTRLQKSRNSLQPDDKKPVLGTHHHRLASSRPAVAGGQVAGGAVVGSVL
jgi:hypothetical protein